MYVCAFLKIVPLQRFALRSANIVFAVNVVFHAVY